MILSWLGLILGVSAILLGNSLEGGHLSSLIQPTAALIVFGGTFGATMLSTTTEDFLRSIQALPKVFFKGAPDFGPLIKELVNLATVARREGIIALDRFLPNLQNRFLQDHLRHVIDGYDPDVLRQMMEEQIEHEEEKMLAAAKVWESAGGYSPTIGILGAVLGLIHVMSNLSDSSKLGAGIAVAFVATVYGVGGANLILLPISNKIKKMTVLQMHEYKLIYMGLLGIQNGQNPRLIAERMQSLGSHGKEEGEEAQAAAKQAA